MGLFDRAKEAVGMGSSDSGGAEDIAGEFAEEVDEEIEEAGEFEEEDWEDEGEVTEMREWNSAYKFCEEFLEPQGFASMTEFTMKAMAYQVNQDPQFRDRIQNGTQVINQLSQMKRQMDEIQGKDDEEVDYRQKAEKLKAANETIDQVQKLTGEEDAIVRDALGLGGELVEAIASGQQRAGGGSANVNTSTNAVDEEL